MQLVTTEQPTSSQAETAQSPRPKKTGFGKELGKLGTASFIYLIPVALSRGLNFLFIPLYTHALTPSDFGVLSLATTIQTLLTTVLGFGVHTTTYRLHYQWKSEDERRKLYGTLLIFLALAPLAITLVLYAIGLAGGFDHTFKILAFDPYLKLVLWAGYLGVFQALPLNILMIREMPRAAAIYNMVTFVVTAGTMLTFVVVLHEGVIGQLRAVLISQAVLAVVSVGITSRFASFTLSKEHLYAALAFGLPLVPHLVSNWGLAVSDRFVLEQYVSKSEMGLYSLAYTFNAVAAIVAGSVQKSLFPMVTRKLAEDDGASDVPRLGTSALLGVTVAALVCAMFASDGMVVLQIPKTYYGARPFVPWLVLGVVFQTLYQLLSQGTFYAKKTKLVPVITVTAVAVNIGLNLLFVPHFGAMAAAIDTALAFAVLAALHGWLAYRSFPIAWEYGRWAKLLGVAAITFAIGDLGSNWPVYFSIPYKCAIFAVVLPGGLVLTRFMSGQELRTTIQLFTGKFAAIHKRLTRRRR